MKAFVALIIALTFVGCSSSEFDFSQLEGTWETDKKSYESWERESNSTWSGLGYTTEKSDTAIFEYLTIQELKGQWQYVARVPSQNNGRPITFKMKRATETTALFENLNHDFPKSIHYNMVSEDSLVVTNSGTIQGVIREVQFIFKKKGV